MVHMPCQPLSHSKANGMNHAWAAGWGQAYHVVTPITHGPFEIICAAIGFAQSLEAVEAEQLVLLLFGHAAHSTTQRGGHGEVGLEIAEQELVHFVENGNLNVDEEGELLAE